NDDILVAGSTRYDSQLAALDAIMAEWSSATDYATRLEHLMGPDAGLNTVGSQGVFLRAGPTAAQATVYDDASVDVLTGAAGHDWFWANVEGCGVHDRITDLAGSEFANDLAFIQA